MEPAGLKVARGLLAGVVAGAVASFAMDRFQAMVTGLLPPSDDDGDPATVEAVEAVVGPVPDEAKPLAGQAMHYLLGIGLGAAYGAAAEFRPAITAGHGTCLALGSATLFDQVAVHAAGLGDPPWRTSPVTTLYSYASHAVFGGVTELIRRQVRTTLIPSS